MTSVHSVDTRSGEAKSAQIVEGQEARDWEVLSRLELGRVGQRRSDCSVFVDRSEPPDFLLYGPYWRLLSGHYRLAFRCRARRPRHRSQPVLGLEVIVQNRVQQAWRDFTADELASGEAVLDFEVPPALGVEAGSDARFEFRVYHLHNADLMIGSVDLHRLETAPAVVAPPRRWRLLGRQRLAWRARRGHAGEVFIRGWPQPGVVLYGGRPPLCLPEGTYRLAVHGQSAMRRGNAPVIAVEVVARPWAGIGAVGEVPSRDRTRICTADFTGAELSAGGALEFSLSGDFGLEGGDNVPIEVYVTTLGGRSVVIDSLAICEIQGEPGSAAPPLRWRLAGWMRGDVCGRSDPATGIRVAREERPGRFFMSRRPHLPLHSGSFRLSFRAAAEALRDVTVPVLAVTLTVEPRVAPLGLRSRSRPPPPPVCLVERQFLASQLAGGQVELEFAVPAGIEPDRFSCRLSFRHFGNADLVLGALELSEIEAADTLALSARGPKPRRNVLVIGNCQAETIRIGFEKAEPLRARFKAKYQFVGVKEYLHRRAIQELRECDVLLVQDIREWESYPLKEFIPDGIEIIQYPLLSFGSLWPFDHHSGLPDNEAHQREWPNLTFLYLDGLLGRLRGELADHEARFAAYRDLNIPGLVNFVRLHDFERRRLLQLDERFGGGIGQYILDNFQTHQLFYTIAHPSGDLLSKLMQRLMELLGVDEPFPLVAELDHLKRQQVPVHPKVAKALGVTWADEATLYAHEGRTITWETYVRAYIAHYG
jgi:hypothetical protein